MARPERKISSFSSFLLTMSMRRVWSELVVATAVMSTTLLPAQGQIDFPTIENVKDVRIALVRAGGMTGLPTYELAIDRGGQVTYEGKAGVFIRGRRTSRIGTAAMNGLIEEFRRSGFFEMQDEYHSEVTDESTCVVIFQIGQSSKRIIDYGGEYHGVAPESLFHLEKRIDELVDVKKWTKGSVIRRLLHWK